MDESTFETFDEELGTTQKDIAQPKPPRQSRRPDSFRTPPSSEMYPQRRVREEPLSVQQIPKSLPGEASVPRGVRLQKSLSIQNVAQIEVPWDGVTLNRCLFIAITILVLTSGCQRLNEFLRSRKDGSDLEPIGIALNVRHAAVKKYRVSAPEPETSLLDKFFLWVSEDDDDDDEEDASKRGRSRKVTREKAARGLRHKAIPDRRLLKRREGRFKAQRKKARQDEEESQENVKRRRNKKPEKQEEDEREEQEEEENVKKISKKSKKKAI